MDVDNSKSPGNSGKMKNLLASSFLSTVFFFSLLPSIFLIFPVFLVSGAIRTYKELKKIHRKKSGSSGRMEKILEKEEDSGIDASDDDDEEKRNKALEKLKDQKKDEEKLEESEDSEKIEDPIQEKDQSEEEESEKLENSEDSEEVKDPIQNQNEESEKLEESEDPEKKKFNFTFDRILPNVNFLKISLDSIDTTETLASSLADYLVSTGKSPVLITFRDVATLEKHESTPENTARLQHKKRKIKVMTLADPTTTVEQLAEILMEIFEKLEKSLTWIYVFDEPQTALEISEDRKLVNEIRKMAADLTDLEEMMETKKEEVIDFSTEVIIPKEDGVLWFNSKL